MPRDSKKEPVGSVGAVAKASPRSLAIASSGISTSLDFAAVMSALMSDLIEERIDPRIATAVCTAGSKLLRVVELQHRYGQPAVPNGTEKVLRLAP